MQPVYLICGVSGAGKSWVCRQLTEKFHYIPHDRCWARPGETNWSPYHLWAAGMSDASKYAPGVKSNQVEVLIATAKVADRPIITECPFMERERKERLEAAHITVIPYFVIESVNTVRRRYLSRERKPLPSAAATRATTIHLRAAEWGAPTGTSAEILDMLQRLEFFPKLRLITNLDVDPIA